jgi:hypothetical protein
MNPAAVWNRAVIRLGLRRPFARPAAAAQERGRCGCLGSCLVGLLALSFSLVLCALVAPVTSADARRIAAPLVCAEGEHLVAGDAASGRPYIPLYCAAEGGKRTEATLRVLGPLLAFACLVPAALTVLLIPTILLAAARRE